MEEKAVCCPHCNKSTHKWHRVYYEDLSLLKELKETIMTYCDKKKEFVFVSLKKKKAICV